MAKKKRRGKKSKSKQSVDTSSSSSASNKKSEPTKLTAKFQQIFNQVVRMYERKMYKKGLKSAQKILDKFPHHGDTHAMRGLILNSMDKKKEADVAVKKGLKYAPRSHTCWHVYGMIFRTRHNYAQAAKCFRVALMNDKDNSMILRDMSILQLQIRQLEEFSKSRQKMLKAKSNSKENWLGLAVSKHLLGEHETALSVLKSYRGTQEDFKEPTYAGGEIVMYENMILREFASPERVLKHLDENAFAVKGKMEWVIAKSRVLLRLGRFEDALKGYDRLLSINPENYSFHRGYIYAKLNRKPCHEMSSTTGALDVDYVGTDLPLNLDKDFTSKERETIRELYATTMMKRFPKARAVKIIQILHSTESNFEKVVKKDIMRALLRAQTSYFTVLKTIYRQEPDEMISKQKMEFVTKHLEGLLEEMEDDPPHLKLHAFILLSQHYDLKGDFENALRIADSAISHTPTYVEA
jgi:N-alpha-acetyltransferase 15/16, NatA auxiliary subunit